MRSGLGLVSSAALLAGIAGYVVTWIVARQVGPDGYAWFAVFWAAMYLVVSALAGVQQEVARATRLSDAEGGAPRSRVRNFGVVLAVGVAAVIIGTAVLWVDVVFPEQGWALVWPLAVASSSYVLVACVSGSLYGLARWREIALLVVADGMLRLTALAVCSLITHDVVVLAWAAALPFPATIALLWLVVRQALVGRTTTDVGYRGLAWNVSRTVVASASLGAVVGGLPLLLAVSSPEADPARLGVVALAVTLVRAPLVVGVLALQSYLLVRFRDTPAGVATVLGRIGVALLGAGIVLGVAGYLAGPAVFTFLFGAAYQVTPELVAVLVASSALVAAMCVVAAALLARGRHVAYSSVFVLSLAATAVTLLIAPDLEWRVITATLIGPAAGVVVGTAALAARRAAG